MQVTNPATGASSPLVAVLNGGFDPVAIPAMAGDRLEVSFTYATGSATVFQARVESEQPPRIVRTEPAAAGASIGLRVRFTVVFSEPVDQSSLAGGMRLMTGGAEVDGTREPAPEAPWRATFVPAADLLPETSYELRVSGGIRDLDGAGLATPTTVTFLTRKAWSPGGRLAFFSWHTEGRWNIYTMNPDGTDLVEVTQGQDPSWSPDGRWIAFWRRATRTDPEGGIFIITAEGWGITRVSPDGYMPSWSPDGQRLTFGCNGICVINRDGTGRRVLTHRDGGLWSGDFCAQDTYPAWSPDGSTIAFIRWPNVSFAPCPPYSVISEFPLDFWPELWLVNGDGTNPHELRTPEGYSLAHAAFPAWSPDGTRIAFYGASYGSSGIRVINRDGTGLSSVWFRDEPVRGDAYGGPDWSPDGRSLIVPELFPDQNGRPGRFRTVFADGSGVNTVIDAPLPFGFTWVVWRWSRAPE